MFSISQASRAISAWKKARWDLEETKAPTPMATAPAIAAAMPPRAMVRTSPRVAVTPARKPMVEITPSFSPKMTSRTRSEEHTSELQSPYDIVCRLLLEKKKTTYDSCTLHET